MGEWQPIETAPKDGTCVVLFVPGGVDRQFYGVPDAVKHICLGFFGSSAAEFITREDWKAIDHESQIFSGSEYTGSWQEYSFVSVAPSHWQPLPEPPPPA
jgi:hypothetical protein